MQVGEQHQTFAEVDIFRFDRLLDFDNGVGLAPHVPRVAHDFGARILVFVIGKSRLRAGVRFHQNLVAGIGQHLYAGGSHAYARLVILNLLSEPR